MLSSVTTLPETDTIALLVTSNVLTTPSSLTLCTVTLPVLATTASLNVRTKSPSKLTPVVLSAGLNVLIVGAALSTRIADVFGSVGKVVFKTFPASSLIPRSPTSIELITIPSLSLSLLPTE